MKKPPSIFNKINLDRIHLNPAFKNNPGVIIIRKRAPKLLKAKNNTPSPAKNKKTPKIVDITEGDFIYLIPC